MTKIPRFLPLSLIFAFIITPPPFQGGGWGVVVACPMIFSSQLVALPETPNPCDTFAIDNESSHALGEVVVSDGLADYADFDVTGSGYFSQDICFTASTVKVNGVTITSPNSGDVQLPSGSWVNVEWQSSSLVQVTDRTGQDGAGQ
jgi:hypothetical protein